MKRDMELVRGILIAGRDSEKSLNSNEIHTALDKVFPDGPKWSNRQIFYNAKIMEEAGLISVNIVPYGDVGGAFTNLQVSWDGQEFLDNVSNPPVWEKVKQKAGGLGFAAMKAVAAKLAVDLVSGGS